MPPIKNEMLNQSRIKSGTWFSMTAKYSGNQSSYLGGPNSIRLTMPIADTMNRILTM